MRYFDTHAHPDHPLVVDRESYFENMRKAGIGKILIAPITYESNFLSMDMFPKELFPEVVFAKGLHPKCASNSSIWNAQIMDEFNLLLADSRVVALKSGIDLSRKKLQSHQIERQFDFLRLFMNIADGYNKPLVLHVRDADEAILDYFTHNSLKTEAEVHCFNYDRSSMNRFIEAGVHYFGIGGMITREENEALRDAVKHMPLDMILLESDSPFVKVSGETEKINTSTRALPIVAETIAKIKEVEVSEVIEQTYRNACTFFKVEP